MKIPDPLAPEQTQCPYPLYERLRAEQPVAYIPDHDFWMVTSHPLCMEVLRKPAVFRQWDGQEMFEAGAGPPLGHSASWAPEVREIMENAYPSVSTLVTANPPRHTKYRRLANAAFSVRRTAEAMEGRLREIADELIDDFPDDAVEFVEHFAIPFPIRAIAEILGVPPSMHETFKRWSDSTVVAIAGGVSTETMVAAARDIVEFQEFFARQLEDRRQDPTDDVVTVLANAKLDGERVLNTAEALSILLHLLVAGNETTTNSLGSMLRLFLSDGHRQRLVDDPSLIPGAVDEVLRLESPVQALFRRVSRDVELGGVHIPKGAKLLVTFGAANRDGDVFDGPDSFDPARPNSGRSLAFGFGTHYCLGAPLARTEAVIAVEALLGRLQGLALKQPQQIRYLDHAFLRGLSELWLSYDRVGPSTARLIAEQPPADTAGPATDSELRVEVDAQTCVATGDCRRLLPTMFGADADGKARVRNRSSASEEEIIVAAEACPVAAIRVARGAERIV